MTGKPGRPKKNHTRKRFNAWIRQDSYAYLCQAFSHLDSFGDSIDALIEFHRNNNERKELRKKIDSEATLAHK